MSQIRNERVGRTWKKAKDDERSQYNKKEEGNCWKGTGRGKYIVPEEYEMNRKLKQIYYGV